MPKNILDLFRLDGQVALVTGAASGLGAAIASALAQAGAEVAVHGNRRPADVTAASIGAKAAAFQADLSSTDGPKSLFDLLGGLGRPNSVDPIVLKYIFPNDKTIDWIYRAEVGDHYEFLPNRGVTGYWDELLLAAIFATDFDPANDDPAKLNLPLTYFSGARAVMMTRSDWSRNALFLAMHTRELNGGHPFADRNSIYLFGEGRAWTILNQHNGDDTTQSEVTIDRHPQSVSSPGRVVDYVDKPLATFTVGDASYA